jgi:phosphatidylethanolamine/phosphatidyl-N-methylethanolamine N-methyltransferase
MKKNLHSRKNKFTGIIHKSKSQIRKILPVDTTLFILQFIKHPNDIGALTPSSAHLAEAMSRFVIEEKTSTKGKCYLEAGAGTGAFTKMIIGKLSPNDQLDIIEINPIFCKRLKKKYANHKNIFIHAGSVLDWKPAYQYDAIISSLPFNAFRAKFVEDIFKHYKLITKPGGYVTFCEYMALPGIRKMFLPPLAKKALQETLDAVAHFENQYQIKQDKVFANFPPALVHHCQFQIETCPK